MKIGYTILTITFGMLFAIESSCSTGLDAQVERKRHFNDIQNIDLISQMGEADVIVIGKLTLISLEDFVASRSLFMSTRYLCHKMIVEEVLKGPIPEKSYFAWEPAVYSSYGFSPMIEDFSYLMFLKRVSGSDGANSSPVNDGVLYRLVGEPVGNWHGIVALNQEATEQRAVKSIARFYGVNVQERWAGFLEALRYFLRKPKDGMRQPKRDLSSGAFEVYQALGFPTEYTFKKDDTELQYNNSLRVHVEGLGQDIVGDEYVPAEGREFSSRLRTPEIGMLQLLHLLFNAPELTMNKMSATQAQPPGELEILIYDPSHGQVLRCAISSRPVAIRLFYRISVLFTGRDAQVVDQNTSNFLKKTFKEKK